VRLDTAARLDTALWRAIAVYRLAALTHAAGSMAVYNDSYARPALGWAVLAVMATWTAASGYLYSAEHRRRAPLLVGDRCGQVRPPVTAGVRALRVEPVGQSLPRPRGA
jgi:hypothetical protein